MTPEQFREQERRKYQIQARIAARRGLLSRDLYGLEPDFSERTMARANAITQGLGDMFSPGINQLNEYLQQPSGLVTSFPSDELRGGYGPGSIPFDMAGTYDRTRTPDMLPMGNQSAPSPSYNLRDIYAEEGPAATQIPNYVPRGVYAEEGPAAVAQMPQYTSPGVYAEEGPGQASIPPTYLVNPTATGTPYNDFVPTNNVGKDEAAQQLMAMSPAAVDPNQVPVYPGARNAYEPGNRSPLASLLGLSDATRQRNFNMNARMEQNDGRPGVGMPQNMATMTPQAMPNMASSQAVSFPSDNRTRSSGDNLSSAIQDIKKKASIIRGTAALLGGDSRAADRYEAEALEKLGIYAGQYAMANLEDEDFSSKQRLFQALRKNNMPLDQIIKVLNSGVTDSPVSKSEFKQIREGTDFVTYQIFPDGSMKEFSRSPISASKSETEVDLNVSMGPGPTKLGEAMGKTIGDNLAENLMGGQEGIFDIAARDNAQIDPLIDAIESGVVETGKFEDLFTNVKGFLGQFLPTSKTQELLNKEAGESEWWKATALSFIGGKLAMTKGAVSDREMKIFMDMIPDLSKTEVGNVKLLKMMKAINTLVLADELATREFVKLLSDQGKDVDDASVTANATLYKNIQDKFRAEARKNFRRVEKDMPETRDEAFADIKEEFEKKKKKISDDEIHEYLDSFYPARSAGG